MSNAIEQVTSNKKPTIAQVIKTMQPEIQRALPKGMDADRVARLALTAVRQTPKLANCTPESFAGALLTAAALGLEPNTPAGEAYLIPYGRECTFVAGYQGLAKLFYQSPLAKHLDAQAVYEKDEFDFSYGLDPYLKHRPARGDRGEIIYYYAVATLNNGGHGFVVLTPEEVKALRKGKVGSSDIPDPMRWMERKTALRQLVKTMPRSANLSRAIDADERTGQELQRNLIDSQVDEDGVIEGEIVDDAPAEEQG